MVLTLLSGELILLLTEVQQRLLLLLADGCCHSGEELGRGLGVSRAAIWKQLQALQAAGLDVGSQRGRGYCLAKPLSLLNAQAIRHHLSPAHNALLTAVEVMASVDSTNSYLLRLAAAQPIGGQLVLAEQQTSGRGRRGRTWVSPLGCNLTFSLGWQYEQGVSSLEGLSLAVGVVLVEAIAALGVEGLSLKWPNDVLLHGRKLGGILLEIGGDLSGQCHLVLGVGFNLAMSPAQAASIDQPWAALSEELAPINRNQLASHLLGALLPLLATYATTGFAPYRERWEGCNAYRDREIFVVGGSVPLEGVCRHLSPSGALWLETAQGWVALQGGEISVRVKP